LRISKNGSQNFAEYGRQRGPEFLTCFSPVSMVRAA
jgi:hypothetical protein